MRRLLSFVLAGVLAGCTAVAPAGDEVTRSTDPKAVLNKTWQWQSTVTPVDRITVPQPERYTILLKAGGKAQMRFDCNRGGGEYKLSAGRLSFGPLLSTRMACPPDSLDSLFMKDLQRVVAFFIENRMLYLELPYDSGTMKFRPAGQPASADVPVHPAPAGPPKSTLGGVFDATYTIENQKIHLTGGRSEIQAAPGSASKLITTVFGAPAYGDLNQDGRDDAALFLVYDPGGSGTFYYVAAALAADSLYKGTNAVLLGDRISPRSIRIQNGTIIAEYDNRSPDQPMTAAPSKGKTMKLALKADRLELINSSSAP